VILVDTSVCVEHLRSGNATLAGERLWTRDRRLAAVAVELDLAWE
jgi:predicted nucleic acid-binding protein